MTLTKTASNQKSLLLATPPPPRRRRRRRRFAPRKQRLRGNLPYGNHPAAGVAVESLEVVASIIQQCPQRKSRRLTDAMQLPV
jgi:hypothetical protein